MNTLSDAMLNEIRYGYGDNMTELTHDLTISETNLRGRVPVCACGWIGSVHLPPCKRTGKFKSYAISEAEREAKKEWEQHVFA